MVKGLNCGRKIVSSIFRDESSGPLHSFYVALKKGGGRFILIPYFANFRKASSRQENLTVFRLNSDSIQ